MIKLWFLKRFDSLLDFPLKVLQRKPFIRSNSPSSILIIKLSALGEILCLMPSIRMLSIAFPNTKIDWLTTSRSNPDLFTSLPFLNKIEILSTNPFNMLYKLFAMLPKLRKYDIIIDYEQYYRISELIAYFGKNNAGFVTFLKGNTFAVQEVYHNLRNEKIQFKKLTEKIIELYFIKPQMFIPLLPELLYNFKPNNKLNNFLKTFEKYNKPVIIFYPGSSNNANFRRWKIEYYIEVIESLKSIYTIIVAGGPDELPIKKKFNDLKINNWIGELSLLEWCWIFKFHSNIFIGTDAGLLHLADIIGLKTLSIFGPNLYQKWGSLQNGSSGIEIDLECRPCIKPFARQVPQKCLRGDVFCLNSIKPESVVLEIRKKLGNSLN